MLVVMFVVSLLMIIFSCYGLVRQARWSLRATGFLSLIQAVFGVFAYLISGNWLYLVIAGVFYAISAGVLVWLDETEKLNNEKHVVS